MPFVRGRRNVKNAVDCFSISTSGPELWPIEVCRIVPPLGVNCPETLRHKFHQRAHLVDLGQYLATVEKKIICPFFGSNSFSTLKFAEIFGLGVFRRNLDSVNMGVMVQL